MPNGVVIIPRNPELYKIVNGEFERKCGTCNTFLSLEEFGIRPEGSPRTSCNKCRREVENHKTKERVGPPNFDLWKPTGDLKIVTGMFGC